MPFSTDNPLTSPRVMHAVVGHGLPVYFLNAVHSVLHMAAGDDLLIVDNASGLPSLTRQFETIAAANDRVRVITRTENDLARNGKVGSLYEAYRDVMGVALSGGYDLLHIVQNDMQLVAWDAEALAAARQLYDKVTECVNLHTTAIPADRSRETDAIVPGGPLHLVRYGLSDTGLYHLARWRERGMDFADSETAHAHLYREQGLKVLCHPCPPVAQIPWPAVVRSGRARGHEVRPVHPLLLRPLDAGERARARSRSEPVWLEDVCIPWGWTCLTPMLPTAPESIDYWVYRYRSLRAGDLRRAIPRWARRGLPPGTRVRRVQRRPPLWQLVAYPPWHAVRRLLQRL